MECDFKIFLYLKIKLLAFYIHKRPSLNFWLFLDADAVQTQLKFRLSRYRTVFKPGPTPIVFTHSLKLKSDMNLLSILFFSQVFATKLNEFLPIVGEQILSEGNV